MTAQSLLLLIAFSPPFARANPSHSNAVAYARVGKIQAIAGTAMLAVNILLSWQTVRALL